MGQRFDVVVLGGINSDFIIRGPMLPKPGQSVLGEALYLGAGGKGANQAVAAARLGARVALIGAVGADARGKELLDKLEGEGVDTSHVFKKARAQTGAAVITVDAKGEKQISAALGANLSLTVGDIRKASGILTATKVLLTQFESPVPCIIAAARLAKKNGARVVLDPAPARQLPAQLARLLTLIRPNADEAQVLTGIAVRNRPRALAAARDLLARGIEIVALEAGDEGDLLVTRDEELLLPRLKVKSIDATGAGDAFVAGIAVGIAEDLSLREMGRLANTTAALATTKLGAQEGLPTRRQVTALLKKEESRP